jgi:hypothetical protein
MSTITNSQAADIAIKILDIAGDALEDRRLTTAEEREWLRTAIPQLGAWKFTKAGAWNSYVDDLIGSAQMLLKSKVARGTFVEFYEDTVSDFQSDIIAFECEHGREVIS